MQENPVYLNLIYSSPLAYNDTRKKFSDLISV